MTSFEAQWFPKGVDGYLVLVQDDSFADHSGQFLEDLTQAKIFLKTGRRTDRPIKLAIEATSRHLKRYLLMIPYFETRHVLLLFF